MIFIEAPLPGVHVIDIERNEDERGFFARSWCRDEFETRGLNGNAAQCNISFNRRRGTLRGLHYQTPPHSEAKLVRCTTGSIYDVALDLRPESLTFKQWFGVELSAQNRRMLYIPEGFAHGFQTLEDDSEVCYLMSDSYRPECTAGVRWDDPAWRIDWPIADPILSEKDRAYSDFPVQT